MKLSTLQMPRLTQTARGGKRMATMPKQMSAPHMMSVLIRGRLEYVRRCAGAEMLEKQYKYGLECGCLVT